jgi:hypothetical protein
MYKLAILLLFPFFSPSQNQKLDAVNGYSYFKFGSSPKDYKDLIVEIDEGNTRLYSLDKPIINIDGIEFEYVHLTFLNNKLATISMQAKNLSAHKMLQFLKETYGDPKINPKNKACEWKGASVDLMFNNTKNVAVIDFYSKKIK